MSQEMLEELILTAKQNAMSGIDDLHSLYVEAVAACCWGCSDKNKELLEIARDEVRKATWESMFLEQEIREKYKDE